MAGMQYIKRHIIHWFAIIGILMSALAPSISQAMAVSQTGQGIAVEICTVSGQKMVQFIADDKNSEATEMKHCPYCTLQASVEIDLNTQLHFAQENEQLFPRLFYQSPKPLFAWLTLPSRAPPQLA